MLQVKGKVVLVFGGNGGIGKCTVLELLEHGVKGIVIADLNDNMNYLEGVKEYDPIQFNKVEFLMTDVTNLAHIKSVFEIALSIFGAVDIVINCAAVISENNYGKNITINLIGTIHIVNEAYKYLPRYKSSKSEEAVIVNMASVAGLVPLTNFPVYSASKAGVISYSYEMAKIKDMEGDFEVKIITLCPAATETPMLNVGRSLCETTTGQIQNNMIQIFKTTPAQKPESVAKCILHIIAHGENGSCWLSKNDEDAKLIDYDAILTLASSMLDD